MQIRQRGKERCHMEDDHVLVKDQICYVICLQLAFASKHLHLAFAPCICKQAFAACICKQAFAACICKQAFAACSLHLQLAFASKHLQVKVLVNQTPLKTAGDQLYPS
ncbi:hypothetical protein Tco_1324569 [Tanacetum coccineum]